MTPSVLIVDDQQSLREMLEILLSRGGISGRNRRKRPGGPGTLPKNPFLRRPDRYPHAPHGRSALLKEIKTRQPQTEVIMISAYADQETAIEAMNEGAYDFFPKPFDNKELKQVSQGCLIQSRRRISPSDWKNPLSYFPGRQTLVGQSAQMKKVFDLILKASSGRSVMS